MQFSSARSFVPCLVAIQAGARAFEVAVMFPLLNGIPGPLRKTYQSRCLVVLRPKGAPGQITFHAGADDLKAAAIMTKTENQ